MQPPCGQGGVFRAGDSRQTMQVKFIFAAKHAGFSGYGRTIIVFCRLVHALVIRAVGIAEEMNFALQLLLQQAAALMKLEIYLSGCESGEYGMRQGRGADSDERGIKRG